MVNPYFSLDYNNPFNKKLRYDKNPFSVNPNNWRKPSVKKTTTIEYVPSPLQIKEREDYQNNYREFIMSGDQTKNPPPKAPDLSRKTLWGIEYSDKIENIFAPNMKNTSKQGMNEISTMAGAYHGNYQKKNFKTGGKVSNNNTGMLDKAPNIGQIGNQYIDFSKDVGTQIKAGSRKRKLASRRQKTLNMKNNPSLSSANAILKSLGQKPIEVRVTKGQYRPYYKGGDPASVVASHQNRQSKVEWAKQYGLNIDPNKSVTIQTGVKTLRRSYTRTIHNGRRVSGHYYYDKPIKKKVSFKDAPSAYKTQFLFDKLKKESAEKKSRYVDLYDPIDVDLKKELANTQRSIASLKAKEKKMTLLRYKSGSPSARAQAQRVAPIRTSISKLTRREKELKDEIDSIQYSYYAISDSDLTSAEQYKKELITGIGETKDTIRTVKQALAVSPLKDSPSLIDDDSPKQRYLAYQNRPESELGKTTKAEIDPIVSSLSSKISTVDSDITKQENIIKNAEARIKSYDPAIKAVSSRGMWDGAGNACTRGMSWGGHNNADCSAFKQGVQIRKEIGVEQQKIDNAKQRLEEINADQSYRIKENTNLQNTIEFVKGKSATMTINGNVVAVRDNMGYIEVKDEVIYKKYIPNTPESYVREKNPDYQKMRLVELEGRYDTRSEEYDDIVKEAKRFEESEKVRILKEQKAKERLHMERSRFAGSTGVRRASIRNTVPKHIRRG